MSNVFTVMKSTRYGEQSFNCSNLWYSVLDHFGRGIHAPVWDASVVTKVIRDTTLISHSRWLKLTAHTSSALPLSAGF